MAEYVLHSMYGMTFLFTLIGMAFLLVAIGAVIVLPLVVPFVSMSLSAERFLSIGRWPVLMMVIIAWMTAWAQIKDKSIRRLTRYRYSDGVECQS